MTLLYVGLITWALVSFAVERRIRADESAPYNHLARQGRKRSL